MIVSRSRLLRVAVTGLALALGGCNSQYLTDESFYEDPPVEPLDGDSIREMLIGASVVSERPDGPYTVYFPDAARVLGVRSFHYHDQGAWRVTDDEICVTWENWWGSIERCWQVTLDGATVTWLHPYGQSEELGVLVGGNPAGL